MGSRVLTSKKLGARISLATLTAQAVLGSLALGLAPVPAIAATVTLTPETFPPAASVVPARKNSPSRKRT